ncbi:hypothetical protein KAT80_00185 [Candidatus Pacearchaeota archaeon]|nr:hypothetical protein [Candidatus Pacearchaeota archaeon]
MKHFNQEEFNNFVLENNVYSFGNFTLSSGRQSYFYTNWRKVFTDPWLADKLTDYILDFAKDKKLEVDTFLGVPEGASLIGAFTQDKYAKQSENYSKGSHILSMARKIPKNHGDPVDCYFIGKPRNKICVIEDVATTGRSLSKFLKHLRELNLDISDIITLTNRMQKTTDNLSVKEFIENKGYKFHEMSSSLNILPKAYKNLGKQLEKEFEKYGIEKIVFET